MTVAYTFEGHENPARGVRGGLAGQPSDGWKLDETGQRTEVSMAATLELSSGERLVSLTGGGGGYGSPLARNPAAVAHDVSEGWISMTRARDVYGAVLVEADEPGLLRADLNATAALRARLMAVEAARTS